MLRDYLVPIIATTAIHLGLLVMVTWGWQHDSSKIPVIKPKIIEAQLVQMKQQAPKQTPQKPKIDKKKQAEEKKKAEALKKKQQIERKRKIEAEQKRKAKELALKKKKEQERKAKEKAEAEKRRKLEEERKRKAEAERKRQEEQAEQQRLQELAQQKAAEEAAKNAELQAQAEQQMAMSYIGAITKAVQYNWSRPPSARNGMSVELTVQVIPSGDVVAVNIKRSSGNNAFDRSAENAVKKAGRFPELAELYRESPRVFERYFRRFNFVFKPDDLRR